VIIAGEGTFIKGQRRQASLNVHLLFNDCDTDFSLLGTGMLEIVDLLVLLKILLGALPRVTKEALYAGDRTFNL
jgi:hypothetical protein